MNGMEELDNICNRCKTIMCSAHYNSKCECYNIIKNKLKVDNILKNKKVNIPIIYAGMKNGKSIDALMEDNRFCCNLDFLFDVDDNATEAERRESYNKIEEMYLTREEMELIVDWLKENQSK